MSLPPLSKQLCPAYPVLDRQTWQNTLGRHYSVATRMDRIFKTCYPIITTELLDELVEFLKYGRVLEVGAGSGYLSRLLSDRGMVMDAIDSRKGPNTRQQWWEMDKLYYNVEQVDSADVDLTPYETILMTWPCQSDAALKLVQRMTPGQFLLYHGESRGGCCATKEFFDYLNSESFKPVNVDDMDDSAVTDPACMEYWMAYVKVL